MIYRTSRLSSYKPGFVLLGIVLFFILMFLAARNGFGIGPPHTWREPPLYLGAEGVQVQDYGDVGISQTNSYDVLITKLITFTVTDAQDKVNAFYAKHLPNSGWRSDDPGTPVDPTKRFTYTWTSSGRSPSEYMIDVVTTPLNSGGIMVVLRSKTMPGY